MTRKEKVKKMILERLAEIEGILINTPPSLQNEEYEKLVDDAKEYRQILENLENL